MIIQIAWRNIWRNKLRSSVVIIAVTLGLIGGIFSDALMMGMSTTRVESAINNEISDIQIHNPAFLENSEAQFIVPKADEIIAYISSLPNVEGISSRFKIIGMASTSESGVGANIVGIDPVEEMKTTKVYTKLDSLSNFFETNKKNSIVIGQKLAEKLKVKIRSKIVLTFQDKDGHLVGGAFRVVGIFKTSNSMFDEGNVFVQRKDLARLSGYNATATNEIAIRLNNHDLANPLSIELSEKYSNLSIRPWKEISPDMAMMTDFMGQVMYIFLIIILLALGFGIVNTMLMVVLERVKELGMLMAIGMNKAKVFLMIMVETIMLSLTGGFIGMIISAILVAYYNTVGINLTSVAKGMETFGFSAWVYPEIEVSFYIVLSILVILTGIFSSIYPARKAIKLNPADAVRTD
ncbi:MAG: ABC transporter permease [Bacteroidales bacterium]|nr:ABC transporter permease [Bacteroidales bacterium]